MRLLVTLVLALLLDCLTPAFAGCSLGRVAELPVTMVGDKPIVTMTINGHEVQIELDTGGWFSLLPQEILESLDLKERAAPRNFSMISGLGGAIRVTLTTAKSVQLGSLVLNDVDFFVLPGWTGSRPRGLLGQNILRVMDLELDLGHGVVRLFMPKDCKDVALAYWAKDQGASSLTIADTTALEPHIQFKAQLNGHDIRVTLDTGAGYSLLSGDAAATAGVRANSPNVVSGGSVGGLGGSRASWIGPFQSLKLGGEEIHNTHLRFGGLAGLPTDMLLGTDFLLSHRVYVANSQHKIYFTYGEGPVFNLTLVPGPDLMQPASAVRTNSDIEEVLPDADAYARRAGVHLARREWVAGAADLGKAIELKPDDLELRLKRGRLSTTQRSYELARSDADSAVAIAPDSLEARFLRIRVLAQLGMVVDAHPDAEAAERLAGTHVANLEAVAAAYWDIGDLSSALRILDAHVAAAKEWGDRADYLTRRCWARAVSGKELDRALADCNASLQLFPKSPDTLRSRGLVFLRQGKDRLALHDAEHALALDTQQSWAKLCHGLVLIHLGKAPEGRKEVADVLSKSPELGTAARQYGIELPDGV